MAKKEQLSEKQDVFLSKTEQIGEKLKPYKKALIFGSLAILVALVALFGFRHMQGKKSQEATANLLDVIDIGGDAIPDGETKSREELLLAALDSRGAALEPVGSSSEVLRASALFRSGKFAEAAASWQEIAGSDMPGGIKRMAKQARVRALDAAGNPGEALSLASSLAADGAATGSDKLMHAQLLIASGKAEEAKSILETIKESEELGVAKLANHLLTSPTLPTPPPATSTEPETAPVEN